MIPNIFVSSTIRDLHYLRDALRDAILELAYTPVMSDYGEVGYLAPRSAVDSCYRTVKECQMAVLIIGCQYGSLTNDGFSITHREFQTMKQYNVPTISFIESKVVHYKEVYDAEPDALLWKKFKDMDHPQKTFSLVDEIRNSDIYNGLIPFTSASDAKRLLKNQIADYVGQRLTEEVRPVKSEVQEILAEIKTLRTEVRSGSSPNAETEKVLRANRFLLNDKYANFRKFCEQIAGDIDLVVPSLIANRSFEDFLTASRCEVEIEDDKDRFKERMQGTDFDYVSQSVRGWWAICQQGKKLIANGVQFELFKATYEILQRKLTAYPSVP